MQNNHNKIINDHHERLQSLAIHKDLPRSVEAYIKEFLLNKEFEQMVDDINKCDNETT